MEERGGPSELTKNFLLCLLSCDYRIEIMERDKRSKHKVSQVDGVGNVSPRQR